MLYARLIIRDPDDYVSIIRLVSANEEAYQEYKRTITDSGDVITDEFVDVNIGTTVVLESLHY